MTVTDPNLHDRLSSEETIRGGKRQLTFPAASKCCTIDLLVLPNTTKLTVGALINPTSLLPTTLTPFSYLSLSTKQPNNGFKSACS